MKYVSRLLLFVLLVLSVCSSVSMSQSKVGVDIYSRYIFRGYDYGDAGSFQPALSYAIGNLSVGVWGAYALTGGYSEADIWASYAVGPITLYVTDYYIPTFTTQPFFNYNNKGGAHVVEVGAGYTGPESMPLSITGYVNVLNDTSNSIYIQASYPILSDLSLTVGFTPTEGVYTPALSTPNHPESGAGLVSVGFTASKTIKVTEDFSLPFNVQYIMNPYAEKAYLIFGISL